MTFLEGAFPGRANPTPGSRIRGASPRPQGACVSVFTQILSMVVAALASGGAVHPPAMASPAATSTPASSLQAPTAETAALPSAFLGMSGALRAEIGTSEALAADPNLGPWARGLPIAEPGVDRLPLPAPDGASR